MRNTISLIILASLATAANASSPAKPNSTGQNQEIVDLMAAPVKSSAQLQGYLASAPDSPINRMAPDKRASFIGSLVFTEKGLGSYSYEELEGMSSSDVYSILSLFGVQAGTATVPSRLVRSDVDGLVEERLRAARPPIRKDQICELSPGGSSGKCVGADRKNCTSGCER